jgi:hypothetical protein
MKETCPVHLAVQFAGIECGFLHFKKSLKNISFFFLFSSGYTEK